MLSTAPSFKLTHEIMTKRFMLCNRGYFFGILGQGEVNLKETEF